MPNPRLVPLAAFVLASTTIAAAQAKTLKIKVAATPPPEATLVATFENYVVPAIDRRLSQSDERFRIKWIHAYSGRLADSSRLFEAVAEGVAGAGLILKDFELSNLPLEAYAVHMPFSDITRAQLAEVDAKLRRSVPELNQAYERHNQVFIASGVNDTVHLFTRFPVTKVADLKDRKLGSSGSFVQWLRGTGAVPVVSPMHRSYASIKNGEYEGCPIGIIRSFAYKTYAAAPFFTRVGFGPRAASGITFNADTWKKIPAHARRGSSERKPPTGASTRPRSTC